MISDSPPPPDQELVHVFDLTLPPLNVAEFRARYEIGVDTVSDAVLAAVLDSSSTASDAVASLARVVSNTVMKCKASVDFSAWWSQRLPVGGVLDVSADGAALLLGSCSAALSAESLEAGFAQRALAERYLRLLCADLLPGCVRRLRLGRTGTGWQSGCAANEQ